MKKKIALFLFAVMFIPSLFLLGSCASYSTKKTESSMNLITDDYYEEKSIFDSFRKSSPPAAQLNTREEKVVKEEDPELGQKIAVTYNLDIELLDADGVEEQVLSKVKNFNAQITYSEVLGDGREQRRNFHYTIRVSPENGENLFESLKEIGTVVRNEKETDDLTYTYTDNEARIKAKKTEEKRLLELLENAENMSEILEIEGRLSSLRYDIENIQTTLDLIDRRVEKSTIQLYVHEVIDYSELYKEKTTFNERMSSYFGDSWNNFLIIGEGLLRLIVFLLPWIVIGLIIFAIVRLIGKTEKYQRHKAKRLQKKIEKKRRKSLLANNINPNEYVNQIKQNTPEPPKIEKKKK